MNEVKENSLQVMVSPSIKEAVDRAAEEDGRSVSNWCRILIEEKLNELRKHED